MTARASPVALPAAARAWWHPTPARLGFLVAGLLVCLGWRMPTERWISPASGAGYGLGVVGASAMLLLLLYPARKHFAGLAAIGSVKHWFQIHMVLGVAGPLCILFHANFAFGAANSNAALLAMIVVSSSGIVGRYFYSRIHLGLYGQRATHADLLARASQLREAGSGSAFMPRVLAALDVADQRLLGRSRVALLVWLRPFTITPRMWLERWRITRLAAQELRAAAAQRPAVAAHRARFEQNVRRYIAQRLQATRQLAELESYERLFSGWHMLHLPLFVILVVAGVVHVIAVHVY